MNLQVPLYNLTDFDYSVIKIVLRRRRNNCRVGGLVARTLRIILTSGTDLVQNSGGLHPSWSEGGPVSKTQHSIALTVRKKKSSIVTAALQAPHWAR